MDSNYNSGDRNSGDRNSGHCNSGNYNSGDRNSGNYNSGYWNSGDWNSGDRNSGDRNSGKYNSGDYNSGKYNSGDWNSGYWNSGDWNSGDRNSGSYNSGSFNSGFFNTDEPTVRLFNKDTNIKKSDLEIPYIDLKLTEWDSETNSLITRTYKEAWSLAWKEMSEEDKNRFLNLPNFDADIFEEITGINTGKKESTCNGKIVEIDGKKYKLTEV
jgi:hypothetical protein